MTYFLGGSDRKEKDTTETLKFKSQGNHGYFERPEDT
jgi:hypothetical protein